MACEGLITADILFDCDNPSVGGLEANVLLINEDDIDRALTIFSPTDKGLITDLKLLATKTGYLLQGVKQVNQASVELVKKETSKDMYKHMFNGVILNASTANKKVANALSQGGKYVLVIEQKWKGATNADAFQVLGFRSGLELTTMTWSTKENEGTIQFSLSSAEGFEEPGLALTLVETDYNTTKTAFNAKFLG